MIKINRNLKNFKGYIKNETNNYIYSVIDSNDDIDVSLCRIRRKIMKQYLIVIEVGKEPAKVYEFNSYERAIARYRNLCSIYSIENASIHFAELNENEDYEVKYSVIAESSPGDVSFTYVNEEIEWKVRG